MWDVTFADDASPSWVIPLESTMWDVASADAALSWVIPLEIASFMLWALLSKRTFVLAAQ